MNKLVLSFGIALMSIIVQAKVVNIPDFKFKAYLLGKINTINLNQDDEIQIEEAIQFKGAISLAGQKISSLSGIEAFVNLTQLDCNDNMLSSLDLSQNTALQNLFCNWNKLTSLDLSKNTALTGLYCIDNSLTSLDVSNNTALRELRCGGNQLTSLDLSKNIELRSLYCVSNLFTSLDLRANTNIIQLECQSNPNLPQICINSVLINRINNSPSLWIKDSAAIWTTTCGTITGIENVLQLSSSKILVKIFTPLGQEFQPEQATEGLFIYQYSDGSTKKVMKQ